jgi:iron(III) transport system permease protein
LSVASPPLESLHAPAARHVPAWLRPRTLGLAACVLVAGWLVFVPLSALFYTAFTEDTGFGPGPASLANFREAYAGCDLLAWSRSLLFGVLRYIPLVSTMIPDEPAASCHLLRLFGNSVLFAFGTALTTLIMGGLVAWVVERTDAPGGSLFHALALLSFAIPGLLTAMAWIFVLSPNIGWLNALLKSAFGLRDAPMSIYSLPGMIWALSTHYFPLTYLALGPALRVLDVRLEEAALVSGARYWQVMPKVTLPLLRPALLSTVLLLFMLTMSSYEVPRLIGRPARIDVFTTEIQAATQNAPPEFGIASALAITLLTICIIAVYFYRRATRNAEAFATITGKGYMPTRIQLRQWRWPVAIGIALLFAITLGLPLLTLVWQSFYRNLAQPFMASPGVATLDNYRFILSYPIFVDAVKTSVSLGAMAATLVVALTFVMAWIALRAVPRAGWALDSLAFTPIAVPHVIVGASVLFAYLMLPRELPIPFIGTIPIPSVYNTIWILLIAYVTMYLPYGMRFISGGLMQIHKELEEVAEVAGARIRQIFLRILLPLLAPVLCAAWIYVFVLAVRELAASVFLVGPGTHVLGTISLTMWEEGGSYGAVSALGVIQITPLIAIVAALRWLELRVQRRAEASAAKARAAG